MKQKRRLQLPLVIRAQSCSETGYLAVSNDAPSLAFRRKKQHLLESSSLEPSVTNISVPPASSFWERAATAFEGLRWASGSCVHQLWNAPLIKPCRASHTPGGVGKAATPSLATGCYSRQCCRSSSAIFVTSSARSAAWK